VDGDMARPILPDARLRIMALPVPVCARSALTAPSCGSTIGLACVSRWPALGLLVWAALPDGRGDWCALA